MRIVWPGTYPRRQYIVRGPDGAQEVFDRLKHGILAADSETTGLNWRVDRVGGLCFAAGDTAAFFMKGALGVAARWFADQVKNRRKLVFHGGKFDMHMIRETFGIHISYPVHDTLTMSRLLDNRGVRIDRYPFYSYNHDLDILAEGHLGAMEAKGDHVRLIESVRLAHAELTGSKMKRKAPMADWLLAPARKSGIYGLRDPWYTLQLYDMFISMIQHWPQPEGYPSLMSLYQNERWLTLALRDMEERGVLMDRDYINEWLVEAQRRVDKITKKMNREIDGEIKWTSNPQLRKLFWDDLELEQIDGDRITKRVLLRMHHPLAALLLQRRRDAKMVSSGRALLRNLSPEGTLHAWYNQNVDTGRMSAKDGVHQFARDSGIRKGVVPRKGTVLRSADYSQVEMRYAAHFSGEKVLVKGFNRDPKFDTHSALARRMFGLGKRDPSPGQRDRAKTMNFAMLYGAGEDAVTMQLIDKITSKEARQSCLELGYSPSRAESPFRSLAKLLRDAVRSSYPKMWEFTKEVEEYAKWEGFVVDAYGYHRWLDEDESYKGFNSILQGSAAHKAKEGMVNVYRELQLGTGQLGLIMQIHDDIVYESDGDPAVDRRVLELLEDRDNFSVPILADLKGSAKNWQEKESVKLPKRKAA